MMHNSDCNWHGQTARPRSIAGLTDPVPAGLQSNGQANTPAYVRQGPTQGRNGLVGRICLKRQSDPAQRDTARALIEQYTSKPRTSNAGHLMPGTPKSDAADFITGLCIRSVMPTSSQAKGRARPAAHTMLTSTAARSAGLDTGSPAGPQTDRRQGRLDEAPTGCGKPNDGRSPDRPCRLLTHPRRGRLQSCPVAKRFQATP